MITFTEYPPGERSNASAVRRQMPWDDFAAWLATPVASDDKHAQLYSPRDVVTHGDRRHGPASFLVFEYDKTATPDLVERTYAWLRNVQAVWHTSASATQANPRFRCVVRTNRPIETKGEYDSCVRVIGDTLGTMPVDSIISRGWYRPITGCGTRVFAGPYAVDVDKCARTHPPAIERPDHASDWTIPEDAGEPEPNFAGWMRDLPPAPLDSTGRRLFDWLLAVKRDAWQWAITPDQAWPIVASRLANSVASEHEQHRQFHNIEPGTAQFGAHCRLRALADAAARARSAQ